MPGGGHRFYFVEKPVKRHFLTSLLLALVFGPLIAFVDSVARTRVTHRYASLISQAEMEQWERGSVSQFKAELAKREVPYTRTQWLADSVGHTFFWNNLAKSSVIPALGVFLACMCVNLFGRSVGKP